MYKTIYNLMTTCLILLAVTGTALSSPVVVGQNFEVLQKHQIDKKENRKTTQPLSSVCVIGEQCRMWDRFDVTPQLSVALLKTLPFAWLATHSLGSISTNSFLCAFSRLDIAGNRIQIQTGLCSTFWSHAPPCAA